jgi:3-hydroxyisobutyrate dehydrogenase-like beta-hydroxyacid dehydrogenase
MRAAILGLGEAGRRYAADLAAAGWQVSGYDPAPVPTPPGTGRAESATAAAAGSALVIGLTGPAAAATVAGEAAPAMRAGGCYADFNSAAAAGKRAVEQAIAAAAASVVMADVAVLAPVGRSGIRTPLLVSGPGAGLLAGALRPLEAPVEVLAGPVGAAADRKLLRSVFMKGLAAVVLEAAAAGRAAGCEQWIRDQIAAELGPGGPALVDRLIDGSARHAGRRIPEVAASRDVLHRLGVPTDVCDATLSWLTRLRDEDGERAGPAVLPAGE